MTEQVRGNDFASKYSTAQSVALLLLRLAIGWHFLYEGLVKAMNPSWSSASYLAESRWVLHGLFQWIIAHPAALEAVDVLNIWGLLLIGSALILGVFTRAAAICGIALVGLYWMSNPPLVGLNYEMFTEGNYLVVDKNLVEIMALLVTGMFPSGNVWGLDRIVTAFREQWARNQAVPPGLAPEPVQEQMSRPLLERREVLKSLVSLPVLGGFAFSVIRKRGWDSWEEKHLMAAGDTEAISSASAKAFHFASLKDLKGTLPKAKIGDMELSRMILGGNLIGGWAHARDLIYVSKLVKAYHSDQKVFDTFKLAEACGVNTILTNPAISRVINKYWRTQGGKIQFISDSAYNINGKNDVIEGIKVSVDGGAHACYVQGGITDVLVPEGDLDTIARALDLIRANGLPAGIGAHDLNSVKACVDAGLIPDFWVKTLHHTDYWSAIPQEDHDNIWCKKPDETVEYMNNLEQPWIAFKILAAGAITPEVGFPYAFKNGADFICVGMYDFQIVEDVNLAIEVLNSDLQRTRPWRSRSLA